MTKMPAYAAAKGFWIDDCRLFGDGSPPDLTGFKAFVETCRVSRPEGLSDSIMAFKETFGTFSFLRDSP